MLKLVVVAALCFSKALGEPQVQSNQQPPVLGNSYGGAQFQQPSPYPYGGQPQYPYGGQPQNPMMSYPQSQMTPYPMGYMQPQPMGGYGGYPSYGPAPTFNDASQGYSPVSTPVEASEQSLNPDGVGATLVDDDEPSNDGGLNWNNNNGGLDWNNNNGGLNWNQGNNGGLDWSQGNGLNWGQPQMPWQPQPQMPWQPQPPMNWQPQPPMNWQPQPPMNWQPQPPINWQPQPQPPINWQPQPASNGTNEGYVPGPQQWGTSFTPITSGCYNRCRPRCSYVPPVYPRPLPPRPRPPMPPPPPPRPSKPQYGCRSVCRPMCNIQPSCGMGSSSWNGNTMVCGQSQMYNQNPGYSGYPSYGNAYGNNMYNQASLPAARAQPQTATPAPETIDVSDTSAEESP